MSLAYSLGASALYIDATLPYVHVYVFMENTGGVKLGADANLLPVAGACVFRVTRVQGCLILWTPPCQ